MVVQGGITKAGTKKPLVVKAWVCPNCKLHTTAYSCPNRCGARRP